MPALTESVLGFVSHNTDRWLLLVPLAIAFGLGWSRCRQRDEVGARRVCQTAGVLLALLLAWLIAAGLMAIAGVDSLLWAPPLDRLLGVVGVAALAWIWVQLPPPHRARWQAFLAVGFALTLVAYLLWAPAWADAWREDAAAAGDSLVVGLRRGWDAWFLALAALLVVLFARPAPQAARWALAVAACLAVGGALEVLAPLPGGYLPAWIRLGLFAAGACVVAVFMRQVFAASQDPRLVAGRAGADQAVASGGAEVEPGGDMVDVLHGLRLEIALLAARLDRVEADVAPGGQGGGLRWLEVPALPGAPGEAPGGDGQAETNGSPLGAAVAAPGVASIAETKPDGPAVDPAALRRGAEVLVPEIIEALQTPMNQFRAYRDVLLRGPSLREEQVNRYIDRIDANLARLQVMLDSLATVLAFHDPPPPAAPVQLAPIIRDALDRAEPELREKGIRLALEIEEPLPAATFDARSLARIVDNLLQNASRRSPQGGELTVRVALVPGGSGAELVISVHDWGARVGDAMLGALGGNGGEGVDLPVDLKVVRFLAACQGGRLWTEHRAAGAGFYVGLPLGRTD